jgi:glutathionylspermidine synthase
MLEGLCSGVRLPGAAFHEVKERAVREAFKWNVHDDGADKLCDFPLLLTPALWQTLAAWAVELSKEAELAEAELLDRPLLSATLGIPARLLLALREVRRTPGLRYSRFDFHPTQAGSFCITEGNLDAAGGWNEAGGVSALFAEHVQGAVLAGDPADALAAALARSTRGGQTVGLLHLTRYADDHQVAKFLERALARRGLQGVPFDPTQLQPAGQRAAALVGRQLHPLDAVFRFFPADWAGKLSRSGAWFRSAAKPGTVWANPLSTVLTQSKRFPLIWRWLAAELPTWSRLLPETRTPLLTRRSCDWVVKPALGHEGYAIGIDGVTDASRLRSLWRRARLTPWAWAAQRNFGPRAISTPLGERYPCVGVFVIDGKPAGAYGRLATSPLIDAGAQDAVVLVRT